MGKKRRKTEWFVVQVGEIGGGKSAFQIAETEDGAICAVDGTEAGIKKMRECAPGTYRVCNFTTPVMQVTRQNVPKIIVAPVGESRAVPEAPASE